MKNVILQEKREQREREREVGDLKDLMKIAIYHVNCSPHSFHGLSFRFTIKLF